MFWLWEEGRGIVIYERLDGLGEIGDVLWCGERELEIKNRGLEWWIRRLWKNYGCIEWLWN